jgi:flagellar biosynthesis protein
MDKWNSAVALRYCPDKDKAPKVVAKGERLLAQRIIDKAKELGIPIKEDPALVELLMRIDLYREVPMELYQVMAEIFAFVYRIRQQVQNCR